MSDKGYLTVEKLAELLGGKVFGNNNIIIDRLVEVKQFTQEQAAGAVVLAIDKNSLDIVKQFQPEVVVTDSHKPEINATQIVVGANKKVLIDLLNIFYPEDTRSFISTRADISATAQIGKNCRIHSGVAIGENVGIGNNVLLYPNVVIYDDCSIGDNVIIHSGTIVGADGFGYLKEDLKNIKVPQKGNVIIGNEVEIGANTTIDRATIGSTVIGDGTKIDNLCHIAHNCRIGRNCILAGATTISGSCVVEDNVTMAGNVGLIDHIHVGEGATLLARATVLKDIPAHAVYAGSPAKENIHDKKITIILNELPKIWNKLKKILNN